MEKRSMQAHEEESGVKKGPWTAEEDQILIKFVEGIKEHDRNGHVFRQKVLRLAGLKRCGNSCWLRWREHLSRIGKKKGKFSKDEDKKIMELQPYYGNKWSLMSAHHFPERTNNEIRNRWHSHLKKLVEKNGSISNRQVYNYAVDVGSSIASVPTMPLIAASTGFPISYSNGLEGLGFDYNHITPNPNPSPLELHQLRNGVHRVPVPLPSQGPISCTMEQQFAPFPITGSISVDSQVSDNYPMDVGSIPVEELSDKLWAISEINSTIPAQALPISTVPSSLVPGDFNYNVFDFSPTIPAQTLPNLDNYPDQANQLRLSPYEKAYLEFVAQELLKTDDA